MTLSGLQERSLIVGEAERLVGPFLFVVDHRVISGSGYHSHQLFALSGCFVGKSCLPPLVVEICVGPLVTHLSYVEPLQLRWNGRDVARRSPLCIRVDGLILLCPL